MLKTISPVRFNIKLQSVLLTVAFVLVYGALHLLRTEKDKLQCRHWIRWSENVSIVCIVNTVLPDLFVCQNVHSQKINTNLSWRQSICDTMYVISLWCSTSSCWSWLILQKHYFNFQTIQYCNINCLVWDMHAKQYNVILFMQQSRTDTIDGI